MAVTRIRYDERCFASAEQCLREIASRLEKGWTLSGVAAWQGRFQAIFAWAEERRLNTRAPATSTRHALPR
jgi:hypothetical protein